MCVCVFEYMKHQGPLSKRCCMAQKWASGAQRVWPCASAVVPDPPCVYFVWPSLPGGAPSFAPNSRPLLESGGVGFAVVPVRLPPPPGWLCSQRHRVTG